MQTSFLNGPGVRLLYGLATIGICQVSADCVALGQESKKTSSSETKIEWHDVKDWGVEGKGWNDTLSFFDRLPKKAKDSVPLPVWNLSRQSAGLSVRFETNATEIWVKYELLSPQLALPHMPATGVSGIDLYGKNASGALQWLACTKPTAQSGEIKLVSGLSASKMPFAAYLPLYNGIKQLSIGVPNYQKTGDQNPSGPNRTDRKIEFVGIAPRSAPPVVFYGTSITQGACASRPGMAHTSILGRNLQLPTINLGFSGNGKMELAVAELLAEIDASAYVIDCLPNMNAQLVSERTVPFVTKLRELRPDTPIIMVEDRTYGYSWAKAGTRAKQEATRTALSNSMDELAGLDGPKIELIRGVDILGPDSTTDGSHPSDLGFVEYAKEFEPKIRAVLNACPARTD